MADALSPLDPAGPRYRVGVFHPGTQHSWQTALALQEGFVPGNAGLIEPDSDCPPLNLVRSCVKQKVDVILKNSSGFGGSNVCLVLRRVNAREGR